MSSPTDEKDQSPAPPRKPRIYSKVGNLAAAQRERVHELLRRNRTYSEIQKALKEDFGVSISAASLSRYYASHAPEFMEAPKPTVSAETEEAPRSPAVCSTLSTPRARAAERVLAWQAKRKKLLQEACIRIATQTANGMPITAAITATARRFRNRSVGNGRVLAISRKSMERHWYAFCRRGEAAFALGYVAPRKFDLDPLLLDLIVQTAIRQSKSISEVLTESPFSDRKGRPSLHTIYRALPSKEITRFLLDERSLIAQREVCEQKFESINVRLRDLRRDAEQKFLAKGSA